jgi:hypothetical protein
MMIVPFERLEINGKVYYQPQQKQLTFHNAIHNRVVNGYRDFLYGGAAKGGKSHALRWEAHRNCITYPRLRILLIRSSFPELERTHIRDLMFDLPPDCGGYNSQKHVFTYSNGSILELGYGSSMKDFEQYLSANYDAILVDEMTTIPFELTYMFRLRLQSSRPDFIPFFAGATNPGSTAHVQVRSYFVKKNASPELYPGYDPKKICFIPATVYDNKILMDRDPEILTRLHQLPFREQQKYLYGNWDIFEGQFFDNWNPEIHIIQPKDYLPYYDLRQMFVRGGMDYGNQTVIEMGARDHNGNVLFFDELYHDKAADKKAREEKVTDTQKFLKERTLQEETIIADTNMWNPDSFDMAKEQYAAQFYLNAKIKLVKVSKTALEPNRRNYRVACNDAIYNALDYKLNDKGVMVKQPTLKIYERCAWLIETLPALITDDKDVEDIADGQNDHPFDAMKHSFMTLIQPKKKTPDERPQWLKQLEKEKVEKINFMVK